MGLNRCSRIACQHTLRQSGHQLPRSLIENRQNLVRAFEMIVLAHGLQPLGRFQHAAGPRNSGPIL